MHEANKPAAVLAITSLFVQQQSRWTCCSLQDPVGHRPEDESATGSNPSKEVTGADGLTLRELFELARCTADGAACGLAASGIEAPGTAAHGMAACSATCLDAAALGVATAAPHAAALGDAALGAGAVAAHVAAHRTPAAARQAPVACHTNQAALWAGAAA
ncbi:hypothetical protein MMC14_010396, partial [Varicellaria rhodocarpa]|nr:hypothetical protein [Varicellaria rhodocarpa]